MLALVPLIQFFSFKTEKKMARRRPFLIVFLTKDLFGFEYSFGDRSNADGRHKVLQWDSQLGTSHFTHINLWPHIYCLRLSLFFQSLDVKGYRVYVDPQLKRLNLHKTDGRLAGGPFKMAATFGHFLIGSGSHERVQLLSLRQRLNCRGLRFMQIISWFQLNADTRHEQTNKMTSNQ